jgi:hypothetical protein
MFLIKIQMKKIIVLFYIVIFSTVLFAVPVEYLFIGEWEGSIDNFDLTIVLLHSNACFIKVRTTQGGIEVIEETNGTWSFDDNIIRIFGNFSNSKIRDLERINWISSYTFANNDNSAFNILIIPPGGSSLTRVSFVRTFY